MSLNALRKGQRVNVGATQFRILQKLADRNWQLQNAVTGEWCVYTEDDLLDRFARKELSFIPEVREDSPIGAIIPNLNRDFSAYATESVTLARNREQYLKEIDRQQPISITRTNVEPLIRLVAQRIKDESHRVGSQSGGITGSGSPLAETSAPSF